MQGVRPYDPNGFTTGGPSALCVREDSWQQPGPASGARGASGASAPLPEPQPKKRRKKKKEKEKNLNVVAGSAPPPQQQPELSWDDAIGMGVEVSQPDHSVWPALRLATLLRV